VQQAAKSEKVWLTLDPELAAQVSEVGRTLGVENKPEIIRIMVRQALAAIPWQGDRLVLAREAMNAVKHWGFNRLREKIAEIERELAESGAA
jgi:metal-responsive CopG/Arc/MetJ family transcriptional regulator